MRSKPMQYGVATASVVLAVALRYLLDGILGDELPFALFIPGVLIAAWIGGVPTGLVAALLGLAFGNFLFIAPRGAFGSLDHLGWVHNCMFVGISALGIFLIEKLRRSTVAYRESEERFRLMVKEATDYAIFTMDHERRINSWNPGAERILGYVESEVLGKPADMIFTPEDRSHNAPEQEMLAAATHGQAVDERWHVKKDGIRFWGSGRLVALYDEARVLRGYAKIMRDLTDRKQWEDEITKRVEKRTRDLEERNQEMDAFTYTIAHDLRAPIRSMKGFSLAVLEDYGSQIGKEGHLYLQRIICSADYMNELVDDLLEFGRLNREQLRLEPVSLDQTLDKVLASFNQEVQQKHANILIDHPLPVVQANRSALEKIFCHLISNALKFVPPGVSPRLHVWATKGETVQLCFEDNGIGIAADHQERIFRVFERLNANTKGTGVGLAIVKRGIELMGGHVRVESEPGHGSRFWLELAKA